MKIKTYTDFLFVLEARSINKEVLDLVSEISDDIQNDNLQDEYYINYFNIDISIIIEQLDIIDASAELLKNGSIKVIIGKTIDTTILAHELNHVLELGISKKSNISRDIAITKFYEITRNSTIVGNECFEFSKYLYYSIQSEMNARMQESYSCLKPEVGNITKEILFDSEYWKEAKAMCDLVISDDCKKDIQFIQKRSNIQFNINKELKRIHNAGDKVKRKLAGLIGLDI